MNIIKVTRENTKLARELQYYHFNVSFLAIINCKSLLWNSLYTNINGFRTHTLIGNFKTQAISNIISSICAIVLIFSTWQYTLNQPGCCPRESENITLNAQHPGGCEELQRNILLSNLNLHISPSINITISILALLVNYVK